MLSLGRLEELARAVTPLRSLCVDGVFSVRADADDVLVQIYPGENLLTLLAEDGAQYCVHTGQGLNGERWYHLHVLVDGVWFWDAVDSEIGQRLMAAQNEKAPAAATA